MTIREQDMQYIYTRLSEGERDRLRGSTVLVTGCGGFLGYYFMNFFRAYAGRLGIRKVVGLDNFMLGRPGWIRELEADPVFDIRRFDVITDSVADLDGCGEVDHVIHMASIASPTFYRRYPIETLDANVWGLRSLLDFYKERAVRGFLFFSSSEVYGDPDPSNVPTPEGYRGNVSATGPRACYDEAKRFGETMCMLFARRYGMPIGVARPFNNYGPGMRITDRRVPADFARAVYEGRDIEILSSGSPTRTFCYVADAIVGYLKVLLHGRYDQFNIGIDRPEIPVRRLADIYAEAGREVFGYRGRVVYGRSEDADYLTNNPERRCPVIEKARERLAYDPSILVEEGVRRFLRFIKESREGEFIW